MGEVPIPVEDLEEAQSFDAGRKSMPDASDGAEEPDDEGGEAEVPEEFPTETGVDNMVFESEASLEAEDIAEHLNAVFSRGLPKGAEILPNDILEQYAMFRANGQPARECRATRIFGEKLGKPDVVIEIIKAGQKLALKERRAEWNGVDREPSPEIQKMIDNGELNPDEVTEYMESLV
ncbi:MAG: hypothetical protein WC505_05340 [Patescibacteria group bacterium]